ncbi:hypothetical protein LCM02_08600 [Lutimonas saemankumensis]|uniref:S28 family serine protease n=1 Tax=Lutimonas saemankumensis TaxID=483016 RepID=UPI001CD29B18|nr:S28 family serine protease [Lutimonas saemankumensis]MCA0932509.1 hypothetical protein [Lutimonas saemankumensis]
MKKYIFTLLFIVAGMKLTSAQEPVFEDLLYQLPDVIFTEIKTAKDYEASYELKIKQPLDHDDPSKGHFYQRAFLSHKGYDRPTVIITQGYTRTRNYIGELADFLGANQIDVEHRFFGESMPDTLDYNYLNLKQATADLHHIRQLFGAIYQAKWVSTGISKGGATTIYYRYFYPEDVDVSVPYVAPINREVEDQRLYSFLETVGSDECRQDIRSFQERILSAREEVLPLMKFYSLGAKVDFTYHSFEEAFEFTVLEYPFSFWQYGHDCGAIPDESASAEEMAKYLLSISDIAFFGDEQIKTYGSHYYQSAQEMGYYGYETSKFEGFLVSLPNDENPQATFVPNKMEVTFDGQLLKEVNAWLQKGVDRMAYINGAIDTWSATAVPESENGDAEWFFMEGKHHGNARIKNMTEEEKQRFTAAMERWLSIEIEE